MANIVEVKYDATGNSTRTNEFGMREMQARVFAAASSQYLLVKAPPASGKSRALMFVALEKLHNGQASKVIVAVPERSIGKSFATTSLKKWGFHSDWILESKYNLCTPGLDSGASKVNTLLEFLDNPEAKILVCTHSTLRFAFEKADADKFANCFVGVDEFHHVSADYESRLGELVRAFIQQGHVHVMAMTGSYFRGDGVPVLTADDESRFYKVTYNYYEQLNGYTYLRSLGIGFHFYSGKYTTAIMDVLDTDKKTIVHIPSVMSGESTKDKYSEVDSIIDQIGDNLKVDADTGIITVHRHSDGKPIRIADLVTDNSEREKIIAYLRDVKKPEDIDIIIALGMAKEGFDWPFCESTLTVGYRGSLTEIIQIIGRCTRDSENKTHAQFTNLIAEPSADREEVVDAVNNMLKAIAASLLMEQVLAPNFTFKPKADDGTPESSRQITIDGFREPSTERVKNIVDSDLTELKTAILQDEDIQKSVGGVVSPEVVNKVLIPKIILTRYPDLSENEVEEVRQHVVSDMVVRHAVPSGENRNFIKMTEKFINIEELNIDLIDSINPFQMAYEVISKSFTPRVLKSIQGCITAFKINMTDDEAMLLWPKINDFVRTLRREPSLDALDPAEKRMAEALSYLRQVKRDLRDEK